MKAEAAAVITTRQGRIRYDHYETVSSAAGTCTMCGGAVEPHVPHACSKPDFDQPPHAVRPRCAPFESATFPFVIHPGITWRFEGRVYRCTNSAANFIESSGQFYALVANGVLEEVHLATPEPAR